MPGEGQGREVLPRFSLSPIGPATMRYLDLHVGIILHDGSSRLELDGPVPRQQALVNHHTVFSPVHFSIVVFLPIT